MLAGYSQMRHCTTKNRPSSMASNSRVGASTPKISVSAGWTRKPNSHARSPGSCAEAKVKKVCRFIAVAVVENGIAAKLVAGLMDQQKG